MTDAVEEDCPVCNGSDGASERFALATVAEHVRDAARRDEDHRSRIDEHTEDGTRVEIREAPAEAGRPRN